MFRKQHPEPGARPGTLAVSAESPSPRIHMMHYVPEGRTRELDVDNTEQLREAFAEDAVTWIDVQGLGDESVIRQIGNIFTLHPLLLSDIVNVPQRPKAELYGDQLLWIVRMVREDGRSDIDMEQVSIVLGKQYVITFQERYGDVLGSVRQRVRSGNGPMRKHGADYLAYAIADTIIDAYYPVLESLGDRLETLEELVVTHPTPQLLAELNRLKNRLVNLRRSIWPQREAMNELVRGDHPIISEETRLHLRDTYDHCVQTSEVAEMYREMVTGMLNTYLSSIANRTNEVMKVLTIVATIFIPLSFVAGVYGMNFEYMPELHARWGYPLIWIVMAGTAIGMLLSFWRRGWLGTNRGDRDTSGRD